MLNLVLISLDEFILKQSNFFNGILDKLALHFNQKIDNNLRSNLNGLSIDIENVAHLVAKELGKEWKIEKEDLIDAFYAIGAQLIADTKIELTNSWLNAINDLTSRQIKVGFFSTFNISKNIFSNYKITDAKKAFMQIKLNDNVDLIKRDFLNFISNQICQPFETVIITNNDSLFEITIDTGIKIFSTLDNISKNFIKTNQVIQIDSEPNVDSWIYNFQEEIVE